MPTRRETATGMTETARIVQLSEDSLHALAIGDLQTAIDLSALPLTGFFIAPGCRRLWQIRRDQVRRDPTRAAWVTGVVLVPDERGTAVAVGLAGFHGPPDSRGMVEVGYEIDPALRRHGYANAALQALVNRARDEVTVSVVRATIAPDNTISTRMITTHGFARVGEQWDDDDGLEIVHELPV